MRACVLVEIRQADQKREAMMGNLSFTRKLCISVCWGLLLMYTAAERQYFIISHNSSWVQARNHCQVQIIDPCPDTS
ncbi:hypothetical protein CHARACLAT_013680 [Characodon lateralis]|uniref:Uncharacterized protein n=1 Tax=Characodon lateralis TaxID=208331 RepID=A0ABU7E9L9_9TELE|nr:hypothetical protein [Characodon lateralis]